jgi:hypothetical protein
MSLIFLTIKHPDLASISSIKHKILTFENLNVLHFRQNLLHFLLHFQASALAFSAKSVPLEYMIPRDEFISNPH